MVLVLVFGWTWSKFSPQSFVHLMDSEQQRSKGLRLFRWPLLAAFLAVWLVMAKTDLALQTRLMVSSDGVINLSYRPRYWADGHDHCPAWHELGRASRRERRCPDV